MDKTFDFWTLEQRVAVACNPEHAAFIYSETGLSRVSYLEDLDLEIADTLKGRAQAVNRHILARRVALALEAAK